MLLNGHVREHAVCCLYDRGIEVDMKFLNIENEKISIYLGVRLI